MKHPNQVHPSNYMTSSSPMPNLIPDPSIRGVSWDQLINNRGVIFEHHKMLPCPNMTSLTDYSHRADCPLCDNAAMISYWHKTIYGGFVPTDMDRMYEINGQWDNSSCSISLPAEYEDGTQAEFMKGDKLILRDFEVRLFHMVQYKGTVVKCRYPIESVEAIVSAVNNVIKEYKEGIDFEVVQGNIQFFPDKAPFYNKTTRASEVISISYYAKPVYIIEKLTSELAISQELVDGQKVSRRLPQSVIVRRDFIINETNKT